MLVVETFAEAGIEDDGVVEIEESRRENRKGVAVYDLDEWVDVNDDACAFAGTRVPRDRGIFDSQAAVHRKYRASFILTVVRGASAGLSSNDVVFAEGAVLNHDATVVAEDRAAQSGATAAVTPVTLSGKFPTTASVSVTCAVSTGAAAAVASAAAATSIPDDRVGRAGRSPAAAETAGATVAGTSRFASPSPSASIIAVTTVAADTQRSVERKSGTTATTAAGTLSGLSIRKEFNSRTNPSGASTGNISNDCAASGFRRISARTTTTPAVDAPTLSSALDHRATISAQTSAAPARAIAEAVIRCASGAAQGRIVAEGAVRDCASAIFNIDGPACTHSAAATAGTSTALGDETGDEQLI